jgi:hypothetical protein
MGTSAKETIVVLNGKIRVKEREVSALKLRISVLQDEIKKLTDAVGIIQGGKVQTSPVTESASTPSVQKRTKADEIRAAATQDPTLTPDVLARKFKCATSYVYAILKRQRNRARKGKK